jgi:hypothetical protein
VKFVLILPLGSGYLSFTKALSKSVNPPNLWNNNPLPLNTCNLGLTMAAPKEVLDPWSRTVCF